MTAIIRDLWNARCDVLGDGLGLIVFWSDALRIVLLFVLPLSGDPAVMRRIARPGLTHPHGHG